MAPASRNAEFVQNDLRISGLSNSQETKDFDDPSKLQDQSGELHTESSLNLSAQHSLIADTQRFTGGITTPYDQTSFEEMEALKPTRKVSDITNIGMRSKDTKHISTIKGVVRRIEESIAYAEFFYGEESIVREMDVNRFASYGIPRLQVGHQLELNTYEKGNTTWSELTCKGIELFEYDTETKEQLKEIYRERYNRKR